MLISHHLYVWLDFSCSTSVMSWYYPDAPYLHRCWALRVVWCLDSPCGGSITGSLVLPLSLCSWSQYQRGLSFWLMCVWTWCIGCLCGKKSRVLPVCCIILRYKLHELIICIGDNRYLHVWYYPVVLLMVSPYLPLFFLGGTVFGENLTIALRHVVVLCVLNTNREDKRFMKFWSLRH